MHDAARRRVGDDIASTGIDSAVSFEHVRVQRDPATGVILACFFLSHHARWRRCAVRGSKAFEHALWEACRRAAVTFVRGRTGSFSRLVRKYAEDRQLQAYPDTPAQRLSRRSRSFDGGVVGLAVEEHVCIVPGSQRPGWRLRGTSKEQRESDRREDQTRSLIGDGARPIAPFRQLPIPSARPSLCGAVGSKPSSRSGVDVPAMVGTAAKPQSGKAREGDAGSELAHGTTSKGPSETPGRALRSSTWLCPARRSMTCLRGS